MAAVQPSEWRRQPGPRLEELLRESGARDEMRICVTASDRIESTSSNISGSSYTFGCGGEMHSFSAKELRALADRIHTIFPKAGAEYIDLTLLLREEDRAGNEAGVLYVEHACTVLFGVDQKELFDELLTCATFDEIHWHERQKTTKNKQARFNGLVGDVVRTHPVLSYPILSYPIPNSIQPILTLSLSRSRALLTGCAAFRGCQDRLGDAP